MMKNKVITAFLMVSAALPRLQAAEAYVEPGSLRLTHDLVFESVLNKPADDYRVEDSGLSKEFTPDSNASTPARLEFGQRLLTEVATRLTPALSGRMLFELQGGYADRFWRPNNINHYIEDRDRYSHVKEAEVSYEKEAWSVRGFAGVGRAGWSEHGDFFNLYPPSYPDDDYLGASSSFGIYPASWRQHLFLNLSQRRAPRGFEAQADLYGIQGGLAIGDELVWGYDNAVYARAATSIRSSRLSLVHKNEDVPYSFDEDERMRATSVAWSLPFETGGSVMGGLLYQPFRVGQTYKVARDVDGGSGIQGSGTSISDKRAHREDALAARLRWEQRPILAGREVIWSIDLTRAEVLAGNKQEADLRVGSELRSNIRGLFQYTYRKPVEGPIPFLYEGTPDNIGNVVASPRGPEAPFRVDWTNREAVFAVATLLFDPTPGTSFLVYDPGILQFWNVNPGENARFAGGFQYRLSDYRTPIDRQYFYDENGDIIFEAAAHPGAPASEHPLHEVRFMGYGRARGWGYGFGVAAGDSPALAGVAYSNDSTQSKPLTEYYTIEARLDRDRWSWWGHYGSGVWGPEPYHRFFGSSIDKIWGIGSTFAVTHHTKIDLSYLKVRQDRTVAARSIGAFDEIRFQFSHRFGFIFEFMESARPGYRAS